MIEPVARLIAHQKILKKNSDVKKKKTSISSDRDFNTLVSQSMCLGRSLYLMIFIMFELKLY